METKQNMLYDPPPPYSATAPPFSSHGPQPMPQPAMVVMPAPPPGMYPTHPSAPQEVQPPYQGPVLYNPPDSQPHPAASPLSSGPVPPVAASMPAPCSNLQSYPYPQQALPAGPCLYTGAAPVAPPPATVAVVVQGTLGPYSTQVTCPKCQATVMTSTRSECGLLTFLAAGLCIVCGGVFGCCLIPFCMRSCQDIEHRCPNCKNYIGIYRRL